MTDQPHSEEACKACNYLATLAVAEIQRLQEGLQAIEGLAHKAWVKEGSHPGSIYKTISLGLMDMLYKSQEKLNEIAANEPLK